MAILISIASIVVLAVLLHLVLYFIFKVDAHQLLIAATIASFIIVLAMMFLYRNYTLSPLMILALLVLLAVISALLITLGEQYFSLFPKKRLVKMKEALPEKPESEKVKPVAVAGEPTTEISTTSPAPGGAPVEPVAQQPVAESAGPAAPLEEKPAEEKVSLGEAKSEEDVALLLNEGYDKLEKGDHQGALESFQLAVVFIDDIDILTGLRVEIGRLWFMLSQLDMASTELNEALRLSRSSGNKEMEEEIKTLLDNLPKEG